jgi:hypothetical protein
MYTSVQYIIWMGKYTRRTFEWPVYNSLRTGSLEANLKPGHVEVKAIKHIFPKEKSLIHFELIERGELGKTVEQHRRSSGARGGKERETNVDVNTSIGHVKTPTRCHRASDSVSTPLRGAALRKPITTFFPAHSFLSSHILGLRGIYFFLLLLLLDYRKALWGLIRRCKLSHLL